MNTISKNLNESFKPLLVILVAITIGFTVLPGFVAKARGGDGAAFVGGMIAGSVVKGMVQRDQIRTAAAVEQAKDQPGRRARAAADGCSTNGTTKTRSIGSIGRRRLYHARGVQDQKEGHLG